MSYEKFQNKYRIPSARAKWHNYSGGDYFITICTAEHEHYFGKITNGEMQLTEIGKYAEECVQKIETHYDDVEIPLYVIMPNHVHMIICIDGKYTEMGTGNGHVETKMGCGHGAVSKVKAASIFYVIFFVISLIFSNFDANLRAYGKTCIQRLQSRTNFTFSTKFR